MISGSNALKASRALGSSLALIASSTFLTKVLILLFLAVLTKFFAMLPLSAFFADLVLAIFLLIYLVSENEGRGKYEGDRI